ncbi:hypothetical protein RAG37_14625 [Klebsiella pneumoniae]
MTPQANADWTVEAVPRPPVHAIRYAFSSSSPVELMDYITATEEALGAEAQKGI